MTSDRSAARCLEPVWFTPPPLDLGTRQLWVQESDVRAGLALWLHEIFERQVFEIKDGPISEALKEAERLYVWKMSSKWSAIRENCSEMG